MDDNNKKDGMSNCSCNCMACKAHGMMGGSMCCGWGGWGGHHHISLFRIFLMLVMLGFVFAFGIKMGEFKASIEGGYGWEYSGQYMMGDYGSGSMMYPAHGTATQPSATPTK